MTSLPGLNEALFWKKVSKSEGCWIWTGARLKKTRYGQFRVKGKTYYAHRISYFLHHGEFPPDQTLHTCDNMACVRPDHLIAGTRLDNMLDSIRKGRWGDRSRYGDDNNLSKLTSIQVLEIRARSEEKPTRLATEFGTTYGNIWRILTRRSWAHL